MNLLKGAVLERLVPPMSQEQSPRGTPATPKHGQGNKSTEPGAERTTATKQKVAPPSKKPRSDREERLRTGRDMAQEYAAEGAAPEDTTTTTATDREQDTAPTSEVEDDSENEDDETWSAEELQREQDHADIAGESDDNDSSVEELSQETAGEAERTAEEAATLN